MAPASTIRSTTSARLLDIKVAKMRTGTYAHYQHATHHQSRRELMTRLGSKVLPRPSQTTSLTRARKERHVVVVSMAGFEIIAETSKYQHT